jgi:hypothetical protein
MKDEIVYIASIDPLYMMVQSVKYHFEKGVEEWDTLD